MVKKDPSNLDNFKIPRATLAYQHQHDVVFLLRTAPLGVYAYNL